MQPTSRRPRPRRRRRSAESRAGRWV